VDVSGEYEAEVERWHAERAARLRSPDAWLAWSGSIG